MPRHLLYLTLTLLYTNFLAAQTQQDPWTPTQLLAPQTLADSITNGSAKNLLILGVGPGALIKGSVDIGPAHEPVKLAKLKTYLKDQPRDKEIVIYCGCCPFEHCPNIRPAFQAIKEMGFTNARLLDLSHNIKVDWLDHCYPANKQ